MSGCGCEENVKFDGVSASYKRALWAVIAINGIMFLVEMTAGILGNSQALKADALDFFGDTATYTITLMVIGMPLVWRAWAALFKGLSLAILGLWVFGSTLYNMFILGVPQAEMMGVMLAASGVWATSTAWPDLIVAALMAGLFLWSSTQIVNQAIGELRIQQPALGAAE